MKRNNLLFSTLFILYLLSCKNEHVENKVYNDVIFKNNAHFFFTESRFKNNIHYSKYTYKDEFSSFVANWYIYNDTLFVVSNNNMIFDSPKGIPFLYRRAKKGDYYSYYSFIQVNDKVVLYSNPVWVTINDRYEKNGDTIIVLTHECLPLFITEGKNSYKSKSRDFTFSFKYGIIEFSESQKGEGDALDFHW